MNNNMENQNTNMGMNNGVVGPAPIPGVTPQPNGNVTVPQTPVTATPSVSTSTGTQPTSGINLAPEGVVTPAPVAPQPVTNPVVEPLMGATLTEQTVMPQDTMNNMNSMNSPLNGATPLNSNMGVPPTTPGMNMMGGVPTPPPMPPTDEKKGKSKKMNTPLLIILIVVLILVVGFGVYYFLFMGKSKSPGIVITPLNAEIELGTTMLVNEASSYVKVSGYNVSQCKVDSNVNPDKVGAYEYTVTCGNKVSGPNKITVKDTKSPVVFVMDKIVAPGAELFPEDFISSCEDASECNAEFDTDSSNFDVNVAGEYEVKIIVKDDYDNETSVTAKLIIDENGPVEYLNCESVGEKSEKYSSAKVFVTYKYGINSVGEIYNIRKVTTYNFAEEDEYNVAIEDIEGDSFNGIKGTVISSSKLRNILVYEDQEESALSKEFNLNPFPKTSTEIEKYHMNKDDMCYNDFE